MENFTERQHFRQWWIWVILLSALLVPLAVVAFKFFVQKAPIAMPELVSGASLPAAILVFFYFIRLDTSIDRTGVSFKFFPFHFTFKVLEWDEIEKAYLRTYNPIMDYGGWGIKYGLGGKGMAYNISGNKGLQIVKKTGKKILIGTQLSADVQAYLEQLCKEKIIDWSKIKPE